MAAAAPAVAEVGVLAADQQEVGNVLVELGEMLGLEAVARARREAVKERPIDEGRGLVGAVRLCFGGVFWV